MLFPVKNEVEDLIVGEDAIVMILKVGTARGRE